MTTFTIAGPVVPYFLTVGKISKVLKEKWEIAVGFGFLLKRQAFVIAERLRLPRPPKVSSQ